MFSRTLLRSFKRALPPSARLTPRALPQITQRPHFFSQQTQHLRSYPPPRPRRRSSYYPQNFEVDVRNAKPLITPEALAALSRSPQVRWALVFMAGGVAVFYYSNLETVPVSGRRRFNCYSDASVEMEGQRTYNMILQQMQGGLLPTWDPRYKMVERVMKRLIPASGLEGENWEVHVVQSPEANAFVIPGGKVFVLTGILPIAHNDSGLAAVLGHEIAHNIARHAAENMSAIVLLAPLRYLLMFLDSSGLTLGLGHVLGSIGLDLGIMRPASRKQESEADYIGLMMMARSCYDPEEAVHVWERMEKFAQKQQEQVPEWLSTHPSNENRIVQMKGWLREAEEKRSESGCAAMGAYSIGFGDAVSNLLYKGL